VSWPPILGGAGGGRRAANWLAAGRPRAPSRKRSNPGPVAGPIDARPVGRRSSGHGQRPPGRLGCRRCRPWPWVWGRAAAQAPAGHGPARPWRGPLVTMAVTPLVALGPQPHAVVEGAICPTPRFAAGAASRAHEVSRTGQAGWRFGPYRGQKSDCSLWPAAFLGRLPARAVGRDPKPIVQMTRLDPDVRGL